MLCFRYFCCSKRKFVTHYKHVYVAYFSLPDTFEITQRTFASMHLFPVSIFYYVRPLPFLLAGQYFSKIFFRGKRKSLQNFQNLCILFFANVDRMWYFLFSRTNEKENIFHERLYYRTEDYSGRRFWHSKKTKKNFNGFSWLLEIAYREASQTWLFLWLYETDYQYLLNMILNVEKIG